MIPKDILKKVRYIEIQTRNLVNTLFSGEYHSVFKGRGVEFSEVREYQLGDDIKIIDWNVTARNGRPFVKVFEEERELTVMLAVDLSSSGDFGTAEQMKGEIAAEICALLAFSAIKNSDKVGLLIFTDSVEKFVPPKKGRKHVLRLIREVLYFKPRNRGTDMNAAIEYIGRVMNRRGVVFLISDFLCEGYEKSLTVISRKHDVICMIVSDPRELELPKIGLVELEDAETDGIMVVDTSDRSVRKDFSSQSLDMRDRQRRFFRSVGIDLIEIETDKSYIDPLMRFFRMRLKTYR